MARSLAASSGPLDTASGQAANAMPPADRWRSLRLFAANPSAWFGMIFLLAVFAGAALAPVIYPGDPLSMVGRPLLWPGENPAFPLGTDGLGRDVAAELLHGARQSLFVGIIGTALGAVVGVVVGAAAGTFGGWVDTILVRILEVFQTLPNFVLLVVLVAIAGPQLWSITLALGIVTWPPLARITRAEFRAQRNKEFVLAAVGLGYGKTRIIFREILPNALPAIVVTASIMLAMAILMESALSFMGLGDPNTVSWGSMIGDGRQFLRTNWNLTAIPGVAIALTVLAFNLIGDALNDALNPRYVRRG
ncbi:ABC transporter permease [Amorphus sp. 3PC139-8]